MRYLLLILLNIPVVSLALLNIITQHKMGRTPKKRFNRQLLLWVVILTLLIGSFPLYNLLVNRPPLDSTDLSAFDIVEITVIIFLIYSNNDQRRKTEQTERRLNDLHQELSIQLSNDK